MDYSAAEIIQMMTGLGILATTIATAWSSFKNGKAIKQTQKDVAVNTIATVLTKKTADRIEEKAYVREVKDQAADDKAEAAENDARKTGKENQN
jgi:hypothetical protein